MKGKGIAGRPFLLNHHHMETFVFIVLVTKMSPSEFLALRKIFCLNARATSPMMVDRDRSFRNWSVYQHRNPRWVDLHVPNAPKWSQYRSGAVSKLCKKCKDEVSGKRSVSQNTTKAVVWRPTTTLSRAHSETSWKHSRNVSRYC